MGKTFVGLNGKRYRADNYTGVDIDRDIITNEITNYYVCYDAEPMVEVNEEVFKALEEYYQKKRFF